MFPLLLSLVVACGPKEPPKAPAAEPPPAPVAPAPAEPPPAPAAEPAPPAEITNADFQVVVTRADGTSVKGHVKRVERSADWFGEKDWSVADADLVILAETETALKKIRWPEVKSIAIVPGKVPADVDCVYDSEWMPWMYDCTLKTTATVTTKDGSRWTVTNRHKWRLVFDDGSSVEFWLWKHPAREQDAEVVTLDSGNPENHALYTRLQNRLREEVKTTLVTGVTVQ